MPLAYIARISGFTIFQAVCSTAIALAVGIPAAFWTARRRFFWRRFLLSLSAVPLCIPALLVALGYVSFFGRAGFLNRFFISVLGLRTPPVTFLYSLAGIVLAQGFYNFPLVMATVGDSWAKLPPDEAAAARLLGASERRIFCTITVHQLMPAIVSAAMLVFLYSFFSFLIILLFGSVGTTTLEVEIYQSVRGTIAFGRAGMLAATETALACLFVALYSSLEQRASRSRGVSFGAGGARTAICGGAERLFFALTFGLIALFFLAPLFGIVYNAFSSARAPLTLASVRRVFALSGFSRALGTTLLTATATAFFSVAVAFWYAVFLRTVDPAGKNLLLRVIPMLPMAISSVVLGFVLTLLVKRGNGALLVFAQVALTWQLAFRQIFPSLAKLPQETVDAARLLSAKKRHIVVHMYLPYAKRGLLSAAGFCFAASAGDTALPLMLALPHFDTLALFTYRLAGSYRFHEACASGLLLGMICAGVFALANHVKNNPQITRIHTDASPAHQ